MINIGYEHILAKGDSQGGVTLLQHLFDVSEAICVIARNIGKEVTLARKGAILHDIGKVSPLFQQTLSTNRESLPPNFVFRHEIASLFFSLYLKTMKKRLL